jgi:quinolinate synthase
MLWSIGQVFDYEYETHSSEVPVTATLPLPTATSWSPDQWESWRDEVRRLARERDAVLLAHNYQAPEIQDVADHVGDSLALSRLAAASDAATIVFAGVHFMAETAKILAPEKTVLVPDAAAGCSLADTITADQLRARSSSPTSTRAPR